MKMKMRASIGWLMITNQLAIQWDTLNSKWTLMKEVFNKNLLTNQIK
jgi:hypothetical protein